MDDKIHEPQEHIIVSGTLSGFTIHNGNVAINDNDDAPNRVMLSFSPVSEGSGTQTPTVTATLANSDDSKPQDIVLTQDVTVTLSLGTGGTATSGTDYTGLSDPLPTVTISAGSLSGSTTISITPTADTIEDDLETIPFTASATTTQSGVTLTGVGADLVITEDAALVSSIDDTIDAIEPSNFIAQAFGTGTTGAELTEVRIRFAGAETGVSVRIRKNTTTGCPSGIDNCPDFGTDGLVATLVATSSDLSPAGVHGFAPQAGETINLDGGETYWVTIHEGVTADRKQVLIKLNPTTETATDWSLGRRLFRNSESDSWGSSRNQVLLEVRGKVFPAVTAQFSAASYSATEGGTATVTVNLSTAPKRPVTVPISATNQGTTTSSDYSGVPARVTFGADDTSKSLTSTAAQDFDSDDESVQLRFGSLPSGVTAGAQGTAVVSITDDDDPALISNIAATSNQGSDHFQAQSFTTGPQATKVSAVNIKFSGDGTGSTVRIRRSNSDGTRPDMTSAGLVATLTSPGTDAGGNIASFAAPANTVLNGGTTYWVSIHEGAAIRQEVRSHANAPVTTAAGWTMGTGSLSRTDELANWNTDGANEILFDIRGTQVPSVTLTVLDSSNSPVTSLTEADTNTKSIKIKATVTNAVTADTAVTLTVGGTATGGGTDYTATFPTTVTISNGQTSGETALFNIATVDDTDSEGAETIIVGGSATGLGVISANVNLQDNDQPVITVILSTSTALESAGNQAVMVSATRDPTSMDALSVTVSRLSTSTAVHGTDYSGSQNVTISFNAGETSSNSATFRINPSDDVIHEGNETIVLGATVAGHTVMAATFTITDNDEAPNQVKLSFTTVSEVEGATTSTVTATLANSDSSKPQDVVLAQDVTVTLGRGTGDTATLTDDYTDLSDPLPTITISAGSLSGTAGIDITPVADTEDDDGEFIVFTAGATTNQSGVTLTGVGANLVITEDRALISSIDDTSGRIITPNNFIAQAFGTGTTGALLTEVRIRFAGADTGVSVRIREDNGSNRPDMSDDGLVATLVAGSSDLSPAGVHGFKPATGETINLDGGETYWVTIHEGVSSGRKQVLLKVSPTTSTLPNWSLGSRLFRNAENAPWVSADNRVLLEVRGKEFPAVTAEFSAATYSATEGSTATVTVNLSEAPKRPVTVPIRATNQGNASSSDYSGVPSRLDFGADETSKSFTFTATEDSLDDDGESVDLAFGTLPSGVTASGTTEATVSITDNDATPDTINLSFDPSSVAEDATGNVAVKVVATLAGSSTRTVATVVRLATTLGGTAERGTDSDDDYTATGLPATVTIPAGQAKGEATGLLINPADNSESDGNRTITLAQGTPALTGFTVNGATLTITDDELPLVTLTFLDNSANEVTSLSEDSTTAKTVKIKATVAEAVSADTAVTLTVGGTATGGGTDYSTTGTVPTTVTISDGGTSAETATFTIATVDDSVSEGTETIEVSGEVGDGSTYNVKSATINLADNDQPVITLSLSVSSAAESAGNQAVLVSATRDATSTERLQVTVERQSASTAEHGTGKDYTGSSSVLLTFRANQTNSNSQTFNIDPLQDLLVEGGETVVLGATVSGHRVIERTFTIIDDDDAPDRVTLTFGSVGEGAGATTSTVRAKLANSDSAKDQNIALPHDVVVRLTEGTGTATSGTDYADLGTLPTVTIQAGRNSGTVSLSITPTQDSLDEGTGETISFSATAVCKVTTHPCPSDQGVSGLTVPAASLTITDDDATPTVINLSFEPSSIDENAAGDLNDSGNVPVKVVATLVGTSTRTTATTVNLAATLGGTAGSSDYVSSGLPTSVTIPAGASKGEATGLKINPTDNDTSDGNKTITLAQHGTNTLAGFTVNPATLTLADNELPLITLSSTRVSPSGSDESVAEGASATFRITATRDTNRTTDRVSVPLAVQSGSTATAGTDYTELSSLPTIAIPANQGSAWRTVTISTSEDRLVEGGETVVLGASVTGFNTVPATVTITDDDNTSTAITLTVSPTSMDEEAVGDANGDISVTVTAKVNDGAVEADTAIKLSLSGTATSGTDYEAPTALSDTTADITISEGQTQASATFKIDPTGDVIDEGTDETIIFGGTEDNTDITTLNTATLKINDNDTLVKTVNLSFSPATIAENVAGDNLGDVAVKVVATLAGTATRTTDTTVNLAATLGGTAGSSLYASSGLPTSVTIPATNSSGEATGLKINPTDNDTSDGNKTITLAQHGTNTLAGFTVNPATLTLADDELPLITLSLSTTSAGENATNRRVTVTASRDLNRTTQAVSVTVTVGATGSTAERGTSKDYTGTQTTTITIPANVASRTGTVNIDPRQDRVIESGGETIIIGGSATGYKVTPATFTINDDDVESTGISLTLNRSSLREAAASTSVTVTAAVNSGAPTSDTTVKLVLTGTATSGTDFTAPAALSDNNVDITISANQVSGEASFNIDPTQDNIDEGTGETIIFGAVDGQSAGGLTVAVSTATLTITDDETASVALSVDTDPGPGASTSLDEDDGSTMVTVTATLSTPRSDDTTVALAALAGTATEDTDYAVTEATLPSISVAAGQTTGTATITIDPTEDRLDEGASETIVVAGTSDRSVTSATITLTDDDDPSTTVTLSSDPATVTMGEGAASASSVTLTATLDDAVRSTATVVTLEFGGTATEGADYSVTPSSPTITIPAKQPTATTTITFSPINDVVDEDDETISVGGSTGVEGLSVSGITSLVTLTDDDTVSNTINLRVSPAAVNEKDAGRAATVTVTAELGSSVTRPVDTTVTLSLTGADSDAYTAVLPNPAEVVIPAGETRGTATVRVTTRQDDDATSETIMVGGAATGFTVNSAAVTINDDDSPSTSLTLTVNRTTLPESGGATPVTVTATLDGGTRSTDTTVALSLTGTATGGGTDYTAELPSPAQITIAAEETRGTATITITPAHDEIDEGDGETITVGGTASGGLSVNTADVTINDDDTASTIVNLTVNDPDIGEGDGATTVTVTAELAETPSGPVTRSSDTVVALRFGGSATKGATGDYTVIPDLPGTITIPAGQLSSTGKTITITPIQDTDREGNETIDIVGLLAGFSISGATVTLADDGSDPPGAPTDLRATRSGSNAVRLTWTAPSTEPIGHRLQRHAGDGDWTDVKTDLGPTDTSYVDRGLDYSTTYFYRLFAFNADGDSPPSGTAPVTTGARSPPSSGRPPAPADDEPEIQEIDFEDVAADSVHYRGVTTVVSLSIMPAITEGDAEGEEPGIWFEPGNQVTRADIAEPIARLAPLLGRDCPPETVVPFEDVAADSVHRSSIVCLYALGVTVGTSPSTYSPDQHLTRAQVATMLVRIWQASGRECPSDTDMPFEDVAADSVHRSSIVCLYALGITAGTSPTTYSPHDYLTRAQAATFITRLYEAAKLHDPQAG
ncbi:MAG: S-layer homology domain-containing protein [bacterium]|nr:S-layer homology domain-containing protein [bacterium]